jgi:EAL domain-containing protein (putative c-di-GMP-specific phosphodiesterase class I)/FixJ family two-component response regulator
MKILVVDDESFALKILVRQLQNLGYVDVVACERAQQALDVLEAETQAVGMVFCDLQMPEMDGVEFVRHLVRLSYTGGLVLVSGEEERILQSAEKLAYAHRLDVLGALHKPVSPEQLQQVLESNLLRSPLAPRTPAKPYEPAALRRAIEAGELINFYQPKVSLGNGAATGVEVLVRWQHPQDGLVYPDQFIAVAEENGLIDALSRSVLKAALHQARAWRDIGLDLHVAVNVSMQNLRPLEFPDAVVKEAGNAGVAVSQLVLEVTESRLMSDVRLTLDILTRLRLKRVGLAIDDFGTGHSSLTQLRDMPFAELKIDRGFVHGANRDSSRRAIVEASLGMARELGMRTVAEGVEDRADWDFLRAAGCDMAQGYFIAKPMRASDVPDWVANWETRRAQLFGRRA